jgi:hypothetical protein
MIFARWRRRGSGGAGLPRHWNLTIFADYFQFYLQDESATGDLSNSWSREAVDRLLALAPGTVGVGTVRNTSVPVLLELHDTPPQVDAESWDQVNECSIAVPSGRLVVAGCTDYFPDAQRFALRPGTYRVRVSYGSLDDRSADGLDGNDRYRLQLWPAPADDTRIIKRRVARPLVAADLTQGL